MIKIIKRMSVVITMMLVITGCTTPSTKPIVKTQVWALQQLISDIAGDTVDVSLVMQSGDAHHKEPTQKEITELTQSALFFYVGIGDLGSEAQTVLKSTQNTKTKAVDVAQGLDVITNDLQEEDPHVWLSPKLMIEMANIVRDELSQLLPGSSEQFKIRTEEIVQKYTALHEKITLLYTGQTKRDILVSHPAYAYFAREYQLKQIPLTGSLSESEDISVARIGELKSIKETSSIQYLFADAQEKSEVVPKVAQEVGLEALEVSTLESAPSNTIERTYEAQMLEITRTFVQELE